MVKRAELLTHDPDISDVYQVGMEEFEPSEEQILFDKFKDESQDDLIGIIKVYRIPNPDELTNLYTAKTRYLFNVPVDQFGYEGLLDFIREKYGSGAYRLIGTIPNKSGSRFNKIIEIEAPMEATKNAKVSEKRPESFSDVIQTVNSMMKESQDRTADLIRGLVENRVPVDSMAQFQTMLTMMSQFKNVFGGGEQKTPDLFAEIEKAKAINDMIGGGSGATDSDVWVKLVEAFAPAVVQGITAGGIPALAAPQTDRGASAAEPGLVIPAKVADVAIPITDKSAENPQMAHLRTQALHR